MSVPVTLTSKDWLLDLVEEELGRHEMAPTPTRLPVELVLAAAGGDLAPGSRVLVARSLRLRKLAPGEATPDDTFLEEVLGHLNLVLDLAALAGHPWQRDRARAEVAASLAGALDEHDLALAADAARDLDGAPREAQSALRASGRKLKARFFPPGDPVDGLPLYPGARASFRRQLSRMAMGLHRSGRLEDEALIRHRAFGELERALLAEGLAGLLAAAAPPASERALALRLRQLGQLGLPGPRLRDARRAVASPRAAGALALAALPLMRPFLLEQLLLAQLRAALPAQPAAEFIEAFREAAGLDGQALVAAQVEAAAQHDDHLAWFNAVGGYGQDWQQLASAWEQTSDEVVERISDAFSNNLDAVTTELRETGELGYLLARAAGGATLTAEEKRKVKEQLIDLAKAVPALAIFAAPGGMLLLPLLAKLLPFSLLPGAWDRTGERSRRTRR
jgi:LETM1-like protein